jgi:tetratricopeptide (TPR) repeat protein
MWWLCLVLVLYGIRLHERLMEKTLLTFNVSLEGKSIEYETVAELDGQPISSASRISLGSHIFRLGHTKAETFSTNLFTWYGGHDFGMVDLKRAKGTLQVTLNRQAKDLNIRGAEWKLDLKDSSGGSWIVPTDTYDVEVQFAYSAARGRTVVSANSTSMVRIAPPFGAIHLASSHSDTKYRLRGGNDNVNVDGKLPAAVDGLPAGKYELTTERVGEQKTQAVSVVADKTNEVLVTFSYGMLMLETEPEGAIVFDANNQRLGMTPMQLSEVHEGAWRFRFDREGYEPVSADVWIYPNTTNSLQTNLVTLQYAAAIRMARDYVSAGRFEEAIKSADEALGYIGNDTAAMSLKREATGRGHMEQAKILAQQDNFPTAIVELKSASEFFPQNAQIEELIASYSEQQKKLEEREAEKKAKERAEEQRRARTNSLKMRLAIECRRYSGFEAFAVHELSSTNDIKNLAKVLPGAMTVEVPAFEMIRYEWQHDDFIMDYKQKVFDGSRQCVIVGGQLDTNECVIYFRVIESQTPHGFNWAAGLISAQLTTEEDRNGERAARFQKQIKEGAQMVEERIRRVLGLQR